MALSFAQLLAALRLSDSPEEMEQVKRLRPVAWTMVDQFAPHAPEHIKDEATVRICGYYFDAPYASRGTSLANALANSGAGALLLPYREHRAGAIRTAPEIEDAQSAFGIDQIARDEAIAARGEAAAALEAALAAQAAADAAAAAAGTAGADLSEIYDWAEEGNADPIPANKLTLTPGAGDIIVQGTAGRLPAGDAVMRIGWALTQAATDLIFTRDGNHPADGAAVGTTSGTAPPAYPAALASEPDLFMFVWIESGDVSDIQFAGGTLLTSGHPLTAYEYDGTAGTIWISSNRLSPGVSAYPISAIVPGALILTGPDVEAWAKVGDGTAIPVAKLTNVPAGTAVADWAEASNSDPIPANKLTNVPASTGGGGSWHWLSGHTFHSGVQTVAGTPATMTLQPFPIGGYADYAALYAAVLDGSITMLALQWEELDTNGNDSDRALSLLLNASPFYTAPGMWPTFEAFRIGEQPKGIILSVGAAGVTVTPDFTTTFTSNETLFLRVGIFA